MTSAADTADTSVCVLIDAWMDGYVEDRAWVKVTSLTTTEEEAIARLQREFPIDEQGGGGEMLRYVVTGKTFKRPVGLPGEDQIVRHLGVTYHWPEVPWEECKQGEGDEFWVIEVSDDAA